ncbi:nucleoside/nucleotide kinase family protein [Microbacterium sp. 5K110]|jgi:pantothenate kinase|uniref:nucleoside/nucleotide kinase family protein n=1 Tax=unclassified Microbacterium TaxID=2609290 RepID=UPI0010FDE6ED|nr:nucleoside/nucleotide kinase family protein [Microbacterium sp. 5K110]TLF32225.1 nucleoside/nucleotide kinase family protein [Microbacterium sp. 5K110]
MPAPASPPPHAVEALADRVERAASGSARFLLGIAGSPGSGKTTLAAALVDELNARLAGVAAALPMDGFHLANATLDRLGRRDRKGALDTFDGWGFLALLHRVRAETDRTVFAPSFHRAVDEGVAGEIAIEPATRLVVVEGNYLLVDDGPWALVRDALDETWFCTAPPAAREARLIERHTRHGRTVEAATAWARNVDGGNADLIETTRDRADLVVSGETGAVVARTA